METVLEKEINQNNEIAVKFEHISKRFGSVYANQNITLEIYKGEILSSKKNNGGDNNVNA